MMLGELADLGCGILWAESAPMGFSLERVSDYSSKCSLRHSVTI